MGRLAGAPLAQDEVDGICSDGPNAFRWLPRDLSGSRLDEIRSILSRTQRPATADAVAAEAGVARVTARRYLEYLGRPGWSRSSVDPDARARPTPRPRSSRFRPRP